MTVLALLRCSPVIALVSGGFRLLAPRAGDGWGVAFRWLRARLPDDAMASRVGKVSTLSA